MPAATLEHLARLLWIAHGRGEVSDGQAQEYSEAIEHRRRSAVWEGVRRKARRPDPTASIMRRRRLASAGVVPSELAHLFTQGEVASLAIIGFEIRARGRCVLPVGRIAALAGVCEAIVRSAVSKAASLGVLIRRERRRHRMPSLTNILTAVGRWASWLGRVQKSSGHVYQGILKPSDCAMPTLTTYSVEKEKVTGGLPHGRQQSEIDRQAGDDGCSTRHRRDNSLG